MEEKTTHFEPLLEKVEEYGKTTLNLFKYKTLAKTSDSLSGLCSQGMILLSVFMFISFASLGLAMYLGDVFGNKAYGFLGVAGIYVLISIILYLLRHFIKKWMSDVIVRQLFN